MIAALGFELAIPLTASDSDLANLFGVCMLVLLSTTGLLGLVVALMPESAFDRLWLGPLVPYRVLIPIGFACLGSYYIMVAVATRLGAFKDIASTRLSQGLTGPVSQILLGLWGAGAPGLSDWVCDRPVERHVPVDVSINLAFTDVAGSESAWRGIETSCRALRAFPLVRQLGALTGNGRQRARFVSVVLSFLLR